MGVCVLGGRATVIGVGRQNPNLRIEYGRSKMRINLNLKKDKKEWS